MLSGRRIYLSILCLLFLAEFLALAIAPHDRADWALENVLVVAFAVLLIAGARVLPLSLVSCTLIWLFLSLHEIGAHYTYAEVPYNAWTEAAFGTPFNDWMGWDRNHFDRLAHFCYGLLLVYPIREVILRVTPLRGFWGYFLPLDFTLSTSMIFELFEWGAAEFFGGDLGQAYLGTQGDVWDAHKDMALAGIGAAIAIAVTALVNWRLQPDFAEEWRESFRITRAKPLGEVAIAEMRRNRR